MDTFLSDFLDKEFWIRILLSFACGLIVGIERQIRGKPVGIRTSSLICLGSMNFIYLGLNMSSGGSEELARILAQLITGIGFIGGGVMMARNGLINGVTSAATIWILAGIGAAIGFELYGQAVALAVVTVLVLAGFEYVETAAVRMKSRIKKETKDSLELE